MKKFVSFLCALVLLAGCGTKSDAQRFKEEYESLNGKIRDKTGKEYVHIELPSDNPMIYADADKILEVLDNSGVIYFGFDECPWCRNALPVLIEAASQTNTKEIYYFDLKDERDELKLNEDGTIETEKEMSADYKKIYDAMKDSLSVYEGLNDDSIKRIYAPTIVFVKNGQIIGMHEGTVESQMDSSIPLTTDQKIELKAIYEKYMKEVNSSVCDLETKC